ncbi:MAG: hypothetical protein HQK91_14585 [Nitrospirae bacterium]|nr:hypothetical protein [Nitrospirota bacterium]
MKFEIDFTPQAEDDLIRLDKTIAQNILNKIDWLSHTEHYYVYNTSLLN